MRKLLITGPTGMLGTDLIRIFQTDGNYDVYGMGRTLSPKLPMAKQMLIDFSQPSAIDKINFEADIILHTAAITSLSTCEQDPNLAHRVHVDATRSLTALLKKNGKFFYFSTDSVFNGLTGNYTEQDVPDPLNVYAMTKLKGEQSLQNLDLRASIIRTNIYGFNLPLRGSLAEWSLREWMSNKRISGFTDTIFNAVYTAQLAEILKLMVDQDILFPIINIASHSHVSKHGFLNYLRHEFEIDASLLIPARSIDFQSTIKRPKNTTLNTALLSTYFKVPSIEDGIRDLKKNWNIRTEIGL